MKSRTLWLVAVALIVAVVAVLFFLQPAGDRGAAGKVRIAANLPLTGPVAAWSGDYPAGFRMGIDETSKALGVDPKTFALDFQDNAGQPAQSASVAQKQIAAGFDVYLVGSSEAAKAVVGQIDPLRKPDFIVAFDPFMTSENPSRLRLMANSKVEAPLFVSYAARRQAKSVYIVHVNSAYANDEFGRLVRPALEKSGVAVTEESYDFDTKDFKTIALKAAAAKADLIFVCGYSFQLRPLLAALRSNDLVKDGRVMSVMDTVDFLHDGTPRSDLDGLVFASPIFEIAGAVPEAAGWRTRYREQTGKTASYVPAYAYDTASAIVRAYKASGKVDVASLRGAMPFKGVTGDIQVDQQGDIIATVDIARIGANGAVEAVK